MNEIDNDMMKKQSAGSHEKTLHQVPRRGTIQPMDEKEKREAAKEMEGKSFFQESLESEQSTYYSDGMKDQSDRSYEEMEQRPRLNKQDADILMHQREGVEAEGSEATISTQNKSEGEAIEESFIKEILESKQSTYYSDGMKDQSDRSYEEMEQRPRLNKQDAELLRHQKEGTEGEEQDIKVQKGEKTDLGSLEVEAESGFSIRGEKELNEESHEKFEELMKAGPGEKVESFKDEGLTPEEAAEKYMADIERDFDEASVDQDMEDISAEAAAIQKAKIIDLKSESDWEKLKQASKPVIVDFYSENCAACRRLYPRLVDKLNSSKEDWVLATVNVDKLKNLSEQLNVENVPAVYLVANGEVQDRYIGALSDTDLGTFINKVENFAKKE